MTQRSLAWSAKLLLTGAAAALLAGCGSNDAPAAVGQAATMKAVSSATRAAVAPVPEDYYPVVQQLYIAYFGRPADPAGLAFYAQALANARAPVTVRPFIEGADANATVGALIDSFGNSVESRSLYGGDTAAFLNAVYQNVLARAPDQGGFDFWKDAIAGQRAKPAAAALWILASATDPGNADGTIVAAKLAAATAFSSALKRPEQLAAYGGNSASATARAFLNEVDGATDARLVAQSGLRVIDGLVLAADATRATIRGTVALGNPVKGAIVAAYDQDGWLGDAQSLADGTFEIFSDIKRKFRPPMVLKAEFTVAGKKISLFSVSTDDNGRNLTLNLTPVTDIITRAYVPAPRVPDPAHQWINEPSRLDRIKDSVVKVLGPLLPANPPDPVTSIMVAAPQVNPWDALLDRTTFTTTDQQTTLTAANGREVATVPLDALASGNVGTDATSITAQEAADAIAARGPFTEPVAPRANEATLPAPAGLQASKTGELKFHLSWDRVPGVQHYYVFQQKGTPPAVASGTFPSADVKPTYATVGGTELDYTVDDYGLYYWVVVGVADDGIYTTTTMGGVSSPASLNFAKADPNAPVLTRSSPCSDWRKVIDGRIWTVSENHDPYGRTTTGGTFYIEPNPNFRTSTWKASGAFMQEWSPGNTSGDVQITPFSGACRYLFADAVYGSSLLPLFLVSYENGALKLSYSSDNDNAYMIWR